MNWIDDLIAFYDFVWTEGASMCGHHINQQLARDFAMGGSSFEEMKAAITAKWGTMEEARAAYERHKNGAKH